MLRLIVFLLLLLPLSPFAAPATGTAMSISSFLTKCPQPPYPPESLKRREMGNVRFMVRVSKDGKIVESKMFHSSGFDRLDAMALVTLSSCSFAPLALVREEYEHNLAVIEFTFTPPD